MTHGQSHDRTLELPQLPMTVVEVRARATRNTPLPPYLGATLRGALGRALRPAVCVTGAPTCDGCELIRRCPYGVTWEAPAPPDLTGPLARGEAPRPYVVTCDRTPELLRAGSPLDFRLILVGWAREFLPHYLVALVDALRAGLGPRRAPFELERATTSPFNGDATPRGPDARGLVLVADGVLVPWAALPDTTLWGLVHRGADRLDSRVRVAIETPLHLQVGGRLMTQIDLVPLASRLCERIDRLNLVWGQRGAPLLDFQALSDLAADARVLRVDTRRVAFERSSGRSGRVPMEGLVGRFVADRVHPALAALLAAAQWIHVGKQATFGFGRLHVATDPRRPHRARRDPT